MRQAAHTLPVQTRGAGLVEITREVAAWTAKQAMSTGESGPGVGTPNQAWA